MEYTEYGDSNVKENTYGDYETTDNINDITEDIKDETFNCRDCQWISSCKKYLSQILSNPDYDIDEIQNTINNFNNCKDFYNTEFEIYSEDEITYDRNEYKTEYNTYLNEFYNG